MSKSCTLFELNLRVVLGTQGQASLPALTRAECTLGDRPRTSLSTVGKAPLPALTRDECTAGDSWMYDTNYNNTTYTASAPAGVLRSLSRQLSAWRCNFPKCERPYSSCESACPLNLTATVEELKSYAADAQRCQSRECHAAYVKGACWSLPLAPLTPARVGFNLNLNIAPLSTPQATDREVGWSPLTCEMNKSGLLARGSVSKTNQAHGSMPSANRDGPASEVPKEAQLLPTQNCCWDVADLREMALCSGGAFLGSSLGFLVPIYSARCGPGASLVRNAETAENSRASVFFRGRGARCPMCAGCAALGARRAQGHIRIGTCGIYRNEGSGIFTRSPDVVSSTPVPFRGMHACGGWKARGFLSARSLPHALGASLDIAQGSMGAECTLQLGVFDRNQTKRSACSTAAVFCMALHRCLSGFGRSAFARWSNHGAVVDRCGAAECSVFAAEQREGGWAFSPLLMRIIQRALALVMLALELMQQRWLFLLLASSATPLPFIVAYSVGCFCFSHHQPRHCHLSLRIRGYSPALISVAYTDAD